MHAVEFVLLTVMFVITFLGMIMTNGQGGIPNLIGAVVATVVGDQFVKWYTGIKTIK